MGKSFLSREKGFTLLEVVFAVGILAIGIMGYTSLKVSNRFSWIFAKNLSQAVQMSVSNLEGLLVAGYNDVGWMSAGDHSVAVNADGSHTVVNALNDSGDEPAVDSGDFSASGVGWTVIDNCPSELTKLVVHTTNWNTGGAKSVEFVQVQVRP